MPLVAKKQSSGEKAPLGMNNAICYAIIDLGIQTSKWNDQEKKQHKVAFCWELEAKKRVGDWAGQPFVTTKEYTVSLGDKSNLGKDLASWFSKKISPELQKTGIDLLKLVGRKATLNMIETDDGEYVNIGNVLPPNPNNQMIITVTEIPNWITDKLAKAEGFGEDPTTDFNQESERQPGDDNEPLDDNMPW